MSTKRRAIFFILLQLITTSMLHAGIPVIDLKPITPNIVTVPANGQVVVQYRITNNSKVTHQLMMKSLIGIQQVISSPEACTDPFVLAYKQSCLLTLTIVGTQLPAQGIVDGPTICQTFGLNNPTPNPLFCWQPASFDVLNVQKTGCGEYPPPPPPPPGIAPISVSPIILSMTANSAPGIFTVTNESDLEIHNIEAILPATWTDVSQNASNCLVVAAHGTCQIELTPGSTSYSLTDFIIQGPNVYPVAVIGAVEAPETPTISVVNSMLVLEQNGMTRSMTIQNNSGTAAALNIVPDLTTSGIANAGVSSSNNCQTVAAGDTCIISFTPGTNNFLPTNFTIQGSNTNQVTASLAVIGMGMVYEGGYIFSIDDTTPSTGSVGQVKVSATRLAAPGYPAGVNWGTVTPATGATSPYNGMSNTNLIINTLYPSVIPSLNNFAAGRCRLYTANTAGSSCVATSPGCYNDWYLPAICEFVPSASVPCAANTPNIWTNLIVPGYVSYVSNQSFFWSSTESTTNSQLAWNVLTTTSTSSQPAKNGGGDGVVCTRVFFP